MHKPSAVPEPDKSEIPALGEVYNHARKAYGLVSALLIAWELIGVELDASPIESVKLKLKSPQAAPYVLVALIVYFGFRLTIEWYQSDIRRRQLRASRIDLIVAHAIATASLLLYAYQAASQVQFANNVTPGGLFIFLIGFLLGPVIYLVLRRKYRAGMSQLNRNDVRTFVVLLAFFTGGFFASLLLGVTKWNNRLLIDFAAGVVIALVGMAILEWFINRSESPSKQTSRG
jgi:hypothetical protein